jgi:hypothetical protein
MRFLVARVGVNAPIVVNDEGSQQEKRRPIFRIAIRDGLEHVPACDRLMDGKRRRIMTLKGTVVNGAIVFDPPHALPEGARVEVTIAEPVQEAPTLAFLLKYAGTLNDLPSDFAAQHDHYIHGTPKR